MGNLSSLSKGIEKLIPFLQMASNLLEQAEKQERIQEVVFQANKLIHSGEPCFIITETGDVRAEKLIDFEHDEEKCFIRVLKSKTLQSVVSTESVEEGNDEVSIDITKILTIKMDITRNFGFDKEPILIHNIHSSFVGQKAILVLGSNFYARGEEVTVMEINPKYLLFRSSVDNKVRALVQHPYYLTEVPSEDSIK